MINIRTQPREKDDITFPSTKESERPVETEVNPQAPQDIEVPKGIIVPRGDAPSRDVWE